MLIEFQISSARLYAILLSRMRSQKICITNEFSGLGKTFIIDHFEFLDSGLFTRKSENVVIHLAGGDKTIGGTVVRLNQPVNIHAVSTATLEANNSKKSSPDLVLEIKLLFDLSMFVSNDVPYFRVKLADVDVSSISSVAPNAADFIKNNFSFGIENAMNISSLKHMLNTTVVANNAGLTIDAKGQYVSMRIEVNSSDNQFDAWNMFFNSDVLDHLGSKDWSIMIDSGLIVPMVVEKIGQSMGSSTRFNLESGPSGSWSWANGPYIDVSFNGEIIDACTCAFWEIDLNVDVSVGINLSVPKVDILRMNAKIDWDVDNTEVACCAITAGLFWPVVGAIMMDKNIINWGLFLEGLALGPLAPFIGVILGATKTTPNIPAPSSCSKISNKEFQCDQPASIQVGLGKLHLDNLVALPSGPLLSGTMFTGVAYGTPQISAGCTGFRWHLEGSCNSGYQIDNDATILIENVGHAEVCVCEVKIIDDSKGIYYADFKENRYRPDWAVGAVTVHAGDGAYQKNAYPCKVFIKTNGGARIITIQPPKPITNEQEEALKFQMVRAKADCMKLADPFWSATGKMNPKWIPDPPPPETIYERLWQVLVIGLLKGEEVVATDYKGTVIATANASAKGVAQISLITKPIEGRDGGLYFARKNTTKSSNALIIPFTHNPGDIPTNLAFETKNHKPTKVSEAHRKILIKQIVLVHEAIFNLSGRAKSICAGYFNNIPSIVILDEDGLRTYNVGRLTAPFLERLVLDPNLKGTILFNEKLLTWSDEGLYVIDEHDSKIKPVKMLIKESVRGVTSIKNQIAVITNAGIHILAANYDRINFFPLTDSINLEGVGSRLIVDTKSGLSCFDFTKPEVQRYYTNYVVSDSIITRAPATADAKNLLFVRHKNGGGKLVQVESSYLTEVANYEDDPWYLGTARVGEFIGRLIDHKKILVIYRIGSYANL